MTNEQRLCIFYYLTKTLQSKQSTFIFVVFTLRLYFVFDCVQKIKFNKCLYSCYLCKLQKLRVISYYKV